MHLNIDELGTTDSWTCGVIFDQVKDEDATVDIGSYVFSNKGYVTRNGDVIEGMEAVAEADKVEAIKTEQAAIMANRRD